MKGRPQMPWLGLRIGAAADVVKCARGHDPMFVMKTSIRLDDVATLGATHYLTSCKRCGRIYEERVKPA